MPPPNRRAGDDTGNATRSESVACFAPNLVDVVRSPDGLDRHEPEFGSNLHQLNAIVHVQLLHQVGAMTHDRVWADVKQLLRMDFLG